VVNTGFQVVVFGDADNRAEFGFAGWHWEHWSLSVGGTVQFTGVRANKFRVELGM
jgi:hypothetical protein